MKEIIASSKIQNACFVLIEITYIRVNEGTKFKITHNIHFIRRQILDVFWNGFLPFKKEIEFELLKSGDDEKNMIGLYYTIHIVGEVLKYPSSKSLEA